MIDMKKTVLALLMCLMSFTALCQQRGHFILGGGAEVIFGDEAAGALFYTLEAGIAYDILESLRVSGTLGGFRSVMSFSATSWWSETAGGPMLRVSAQYLFLPESSAFRPSASISAGYRLRVPPEAVPLGQTASPLRSDGPFLSAGLGADLRVGGLRLGLTLTGELTGTLRPAAGLRLSFLLP